MKIKVLGCSGAQLPHHNTTSFLLDENILIDAGSVTTVLSLRHQLKIEYIFVTHAHLDHVRDIPFLTDNIFYAQRKKPLVVISTKNVLGIIHKHLFNNRIWPDFSRISSAKKPLIKFKAIMPGRKQIVGNWIVSAINLNHTVETVGYMIERKGKAIMFFGDTGPTDKIWHAARRNKKLKAIFIETSLPNSMTNVANITGHLTPLFLQRELMKLNEKKLKIYLYHMKPSYQKAIRKETAAIKERKIKIIKDGQVICI